MNNSYRYRPRSISPAIRLVSYSPLARGALALPSLSSFSKGECRVPEAWGLRKGAESALCPVAACVVLGRRGGGSGEEVCLSRPRDNFFLLVRKVIASV